MSRTAGHAEVLALLRDLASPGRRLLDVPSGGGPVVAGARAAGYDVVEVDLFPRASMHGVCADASAPLPFRDASFDVVLSMEGIEHFENQAGFVRECARVLRPGGWLVVTTPNVLTLGARATHLLTGGKVLRQGFVNEVSTLRGRAGRRLYHGHAFLVDAYRLRYLVRIAGLEWEALHGTTLSPTSVLLAPLVPLVHLATAYATRAARARLRREGRPGPDAELERELARLARSPALLFRKKVIALARKPVTTPAARVPVPVAVASGG
jgi:SAM-dependent methyltransferase